MKKLFVFMLCLVLFSCEAKFEQFGGNLSVRYLENGYKEITDAIGRKFLLVPEGKKPIGSYKKSHIVEIPVKSVVVYTWYHIALIKALGHIDTVRGIVYKPKKYFIPELKKGLESGKVVWLGNYTSVDFEKLKKLNPDVVFTWDEAIIPILDSLGIPCIVTIPKIAPDLNARIKFVKFLAAFYNEEEKANLLVKEQFKRIAQIEKITKHKRPKPKVVWGDVYEKKVLVEPGNSWAAQVVEKAGGRYLFSDLQGASCMQITLEKFFFRTKYADILITYRGPETGITSKEKLKASSTLLQKVEIKPLVSGKVLCAKESLYQTHDTAAIIEELASIFFPKLFPNKERRFFFELPEK